MASDPLDVPLARDAFSLPTNQDVNAFRRVQESDSSCIYLCGNSLGPLPKRAVERVNEELNVWGSRKVLYPVVGHFNHPNKRPWVSFQDLVHPYFAEVVGAREHEVACMGTLTANLHLMLDLFYTPTPDRCKILCEARAFPSDQYAFQTKVASHNLNPETSIIEMAPRPGEFTLREEDILETIEKEGDSIALVIFSGVQYYTGQWFPMQRITHAAKAKGCICGWDLAHAVGNVPLSLHDWDVDFAVWCTYKYLNSGPGGIAGLFVHEKWDQKKQPRAAGWWGHTLNTRFEMPPAFTRIRGAQGYQQSNPGILDCASLLGALETLKSAGMIQKWRARSLELTSRFETYLMQSSYYVPVEKSGEATSHGFTIITPHDPECRGAQLSLLFLPTGSDLMRRISDALGSFGVIGDERYPDVIRLAPNPLFNTVKECNDAVMYLNKAFELEKLEK
ncbi:kynureninase [Fistulina hepatica ATCC 64428]|nr:kynureninase [Fistulina hepatica ATCC 64428]